MKQGGKTSNYNCFNLKTDPDELELANGILTEAGGGAKSYTVYRIGRNL